jgi:hypothetical protein
MITLPTTQKTLQRAVIRPALRLLPEPMQPSDCIPLMGAIAQQETDLTTRVQSGGGPAHGLWQFEEGGGVKGVLTHHSTADTAAGICAHFKIPATSHDVWLALAENDELAACFARMLLWTDAKPLPTVGDVEGSWNYYENLWRPGKPRPAPWPSNYAASLEAFEARR